MEVFTAEKLSTERNSLPYPADSLKAGQTNLVLLGGGGHHADRELQVLIQSYRQWHQVHAARGSILVNASMVEADPNMVCLSVADTGCGIGPGARALIFERLYQDPNSADNNRSGLGLGLFMAKELVELHGGRIWARAGSGTALADIGRVGAGRGLELPRCPGWHSPETIPESANGDVTAIKNKPEQIRPEQIRPDQD
jgi:hypothetical protein